MADAANLAQKKAIILTADKFEDLEVLYPYFRLKEAGVEVDIAAPSKGDIGGEYGYRIDVEKTFDEVDPSKYDLLILPGGAPDGAPTTVRKSQRAQAIARSFMAAGKPVGAICHGPYTLISANLVKGRKMTSFWGDGVPDELRAAGALYENKEFVVDGNLVTSRWPQDLPVFMREVMKKLAAN